ncbi:MAG: DUF4335 domain-containing protein [Cyanothece sp. SIO1E1]|nr:DUF4335 domain-containing protein [Cyanothece sp. SIO1E1]
MTIQRKYSLPNCTLTLEGLSEDSSPGSRPLLSILINAECFFVGHEQPLVGGLDFFESLINAVSQYAQGFLSQVHQPGSTNGKLSLVELTPGEADLHHLIVHTPATQEGEAESLPEGDSTTEMKLTTVQLFDLVEAVDQFFADTQTLPDLSLTLAPVSRRYLATREPIVKRAAPAALGVSTLALTAGALFLLPVPEMREPEAPTPQSETEAASDDASVADSPPAAPPQDESEEASESSSKDPILADSTAASDDSAANANGEVETDLDNVEAILKTAPEITDPDLLRQLQGQLGDRLKASWAGSSTVRTNLIYRVAVAENGDVVGYKYINDAALEHVQETPLPNLSYISTDSPDINPEPIAQFKVVLRPNGSLVVSPWQGEKSSSRPDGSSDQGEDDSESPDADRSDSAAAIEAERDQLRSLNRKLQGLVQQTWRPRFLPSTLTYRVTFTESGSVVDYEPVDDSAAEYVSKTPLPILLEMGESDASQGEDEGEEFRVVFTAEGALEVSPWRGYR